MNAGRRRPWAHTVGEDAVLEHIFKKLSTSATESEPESSASDALPEASPLSWRSRRHDVQLPQPPKPPLPWWNLLMDDAYMCREMVITHCIEQKFVGLWVSIRNLEELAEAPSLEDPDLAMPPSSSQAAYFSKRIIRNPEDTPDTENDDRVSRRLCAKWSLPNPTATVPELNNRQSTVPEADYRNKRAQNSFDHQETPSSTPGRYMIDSPEIATASMRDATNRRASFSTPSFESTDDTDEVLISVERSAERPGGRYKNAMKASQQPNHLSAHPKEKPQNLLQQRVEELPRLPITSTDTVAPRNAEVAAVFVQIRPEQAPEQVGLGMGPCEGAAELMAWMVAGKNLEEAFEKWCGKFITLYHRKKKGSHSPVGTKIAMGW
ncbi:uncharacterized protein SPPG_02657 [Spizellomyces punctatus DAOM BR117]|uniref:Uncharacterized protein n=1 Tax=Spizellomyces punctatus (strain DAOM BR117) TaxID=645134 RepID=A0A0L0HMM8_SPIPD|nr:uncharacterized protein SPPG_02657 [Spizellomyces punctatus DAOM BR117]KND02165.1 hypothetical protein SPPG_02657 [Spizellomyces punctatus DAOM BR117]|eukprot:XP_016610204.1 hypothetical protein SPPG_02657 [Spizellomyces punctatus DAOM BR117]